MKSSIQDSMNKIHLKREKTAYLLTSSVIEPSNSFNLYTQSQYDALDENISQYLYEFGQGFSIYTYPEYVEHFYGLAMAYLMRNVPERYLTRGIFESWVSLTFWKNIMESIKAALDANFNELELEFDLLPEAVYQGKKYEKREDVVAYFVVTCKQNEAFNHLEIMKKETLDEMICNDHRMYLPSFE